MSEHDYLKIMKNIQQKILTFIENESNEEENYQNLVSLINNQRIQSNSHYLKSVLYLIIKIANNYHRYSNFYEKLEKILLHLKNNIKQFFSNQEIFKMFKRNKRILLFLIEENIFKIDKLFLTEIMKKKYEDENYKEYFFPEIFQLIDETTKRANLKCESTEDIEFINLFKELFKKEIQQLNIENFDDYEKLRNLIYKENNCEEFIKKRKIGSNNDLISKIIQNDSIEEFIIFINKRNYSLNSLIRKTLLKNKNISLIQYAAFYGSIQIFKYLYKNQVELTSSLWIFAIHGDNPEIISILEENKIDEPNNIIKESIKCHHNHIVNYLQNNRTINVFENIDFNKNYKDNAFSYAFHYYNFYFIPDEIDNEFVFYYACEYDYFELFNYFLNEKKIDINAKFIFLAFFFLMQFIFKHL